MRAEEKKRPNHIGFLTALGSSAHGVIGGFLVLNAVGRPVEFHCTAPVRPNRAQEILYGATLESFVCGEQIAPALVGRTKLELAAVLTNNSNMLTALNVLNVPVGLVLRHAPVGNVDSAASQEQFAVWESAQDGIKRETTDGSALGVGSLNDSVTSSGSQTLFYDSLESAPFVPGVDYNRWREAIRGQNRIALPVGFISETTGKISFDECVARIDPFLKSIDSVEPFERIRLAVEEAQKSS